MSHTVINEDSDPTSPTPTHRNISTPPPAPSRTFIAEHEDDVLSVGLSDEEHQQWIERQREFMQMLVSTMPSEEETSSHPFSSINFSSLQPVIDYETRCCICYEDKANSNSLSLALLACQHTMCIQCLHATNDPCCPVCRRMIAEEWIRRL